MTQVNENSKTVRFDLVWTKTTWHCADNRNVLFKTAVRIAALFVFVAEIFFKWPFRLVFPKRIVEVIDAGKKENVPVEVKKAEIPVVVTESKKVVSEVAKKSFVSNWLTKSNMYRLAGVLGIVVAGLVIYYCSKNLFNKGPVKPVDLSKTSKVLEKPANVSKDLSKTSTVLEKPVNVSKDLSKTSTVLEKPANVSKDLSKTSTVLEKPANKTVLSNQTVIVPNGYSPSLYNKTIAWVKSDGVDFLNENKYSIAASLLGFGAFVPVWALGKMAVRSFQHRHDVVKA